MKQENINYYNDSHDIEVGGIDFVCEVKASGVYQSINATYTDPPEEYFHNEEIEVVSAIYFDDNRETVEVTDKRLLSELSCMLDTQELLKSVL